MEGVLALAAADVDDDAGGEQQVVYVVKSDEDLTMESLKFAPAREWK
jgi:hypothetical protein